MRALVLLVAIMPPLAWAAPDGPLAGTKSSPIPAPAGAAMPTLPLLQTLVALAIVAALIKWVLPRCASWLTRRTTGATGTGIRVEATATVGTATLHVVHAGGRRVLIGVTGQSVSSLAEWEDDSASTAGPAFLDILDAAVENPPSRAVIEPPQTRTKPTARLKTQEEVEDALQRLRRLAG